MSDKKASGKALAKAKATPPETRAPGWELDGMTPEQVEEATAIKARVVNRPKRAAIYMEGDDSNRLLKVGKGSDADKTLHSMRVFEALGSRSNGFVDDALHRISNAVRLTGNDDHDSNRVSAAMALVSAVAPQDELEATMAVQMVAANEAALLCFRRMNGAEFIDQMSAYSAMANKAMRSFALHVETLAKLRRGGEQVVKHVHVNEGGQALIAHTVNAKGGGGE